MDIREKLEKSGKPGSIERMKFISRLDPKDYPEESIEAAKRVVYKRYERKRLMDMGHSFEVSCLIVNAESNNNNNS